MDDDDEGTAASADETIGVEEEDSREKTGRDSSSEESGDDGEGDGTRGIEGIAPPRKKLMEDEITAIFGQHAKKDDKLQPPSWAVYGDTIHQNDVAHLHLHAANYLQWMTDTTKNCFSMILYS